MLKSHYPVRADKEYLRILYEAAYGSEESVNKVLEKLISEGKTPTAVEVSTLVRWMQNLGTTPLTDPRVAPVDLAQYDVLIGSQGASL